MNNPDCLSHSTNFHKIISNSFSKRNRPVDHMIYESADIQLNEGVGSGLRASALAALLAIPGILPAQNLNNELSKIRQSTPITYDSDSVQKAIRKASVSNKVIDGYTIEKATNLVARTLFAEGWSETSYGRRAIATTIYYRGNGNPSLMIEACKKPLAYSCWNKMSTWEFSPKNFKVRPPQAVTDKEAGADIVWRECEQIAAEMMNGTFKPITNKKLTHYVTTKLYKDPASKGKWFWKKSGTTIGRHIFFTQDVANSAPIGASSSTKSTKKTTSLKKKINFFKSKLSSKFKKGGKTTKPSKKNNSPIAKK